METPETRQAKSPDRRLMVVELENFSETLLVERKILSLFQRAFSLRPDVSQNGCHVKGKLFEDLMYYPV